MEGLAVRALRLVEQEIFSCYTIRFSSVAVSPGLMNPLGQVPLTVCLEAGVLIEGGVGHWGATTT